MKALKLRVAAATLAYLTVPAAFAQNTNNATTSEPPAAAQSAPAGQAPAGQGDAAAPGGANSKLPEVQVIQEPAKPKALPKKVVQKPKKKPVQQAAPAPAPVGPPPAQSTAEVNYAVPPPDDQVKLSPLAGSETSIDKIPHGVTTLSSADIKRDGAVIAQDVLNNRIPGIVVDDLQGNAFQTGVQYRGFEASPVNGLPQGLAVYQNGVRINEAFGDTVNWDFIPSNAINDITVMSSNPIFGLNAIGGSISLSMKDGFNYHGAEIDTRFGSFGRKQVSTQAGMQSGAFAVYGAFEAIQDDGFRDFSEAEEYRGYFDIGAKGDKSEFHFNFTGADGRVGVTAAVPEELLAYGGRERTFTSPQITQNDMTMYQLNGKVEVTPALTFSGATYYRHFKQSHIDGNISEFDDCTGLGAAYSNLCTEDGAPLFNAATLAGIDPATDLPPNAILGSIDKTGQNTDGYGGTLQAADKSNLWGFKNNFVVGVSYDHGHVAYKASSELGYFLPRYVVAGSGITLTGQSGLDPVNDPDDELNASSVTPRSLTTLNDYVGIYAVNSIDLTDRLNVTVGGRFNYARVEIKNTGDPSLDALNGVNEFDRLNPSGGFTYKIMPNLSFYGGYSEANRAPTASEIACSDPENPCIIESALASDPPLKQVVTKTWEVGLRGEEKSWSGGEKIDWSFGFFRALNSDDIIQIADVQQGRGYFANAGETQRQGIEAAVSYHGQRLFAYASYAYIDAQFNSTEVLPNENNPTVSTLCTSLGVLNPEDPTDTCQLVSPGDRLPGVPRHRFKAGFDYKMTPKWVVGADLIAASDQIFYGDEGNNDKPLAGYAKVNFHSSYDITDHIQVYGLIENLFDNQYGIYGTYFNVPLAQGAAAADPSLAGLTYSDSGRTITPAIPFAAYGGLKVKF